MKETLFNSKQFSNKPQVEPLSTNKQKGELLKLRPNFITDMLK